MAYTILHFTLDVYSHQTSKWFVVHRGTIGQMISFLHRNWIVASNLHT